MIRMRIKITVGAFALAKGDMKVKAGGNIAIILVSAAGHDGLEQSY